MNTQQFYNVALLGCFIFPVPGGFIRNVTAAINSNTSVTIRWLPADPNLWNGIIAAYTVEYERQEQVEFDNNSKQLEYVTSSSSIPSLPEHPLVNSPDPRLVSLPLKEESLQLGGLEENFVYQFVICYENSAGRSEMSSPLTINMPPSGSVNINPLQWNYAFFFSSTIWVSS